MRVVSVFPSGTELLYSLNIEPVGVSHQCDYPPAVTELPTVSSRADDVQTIHTDPDADSGVIHQSVEEAVAHDGVHQIDPQALNELAPDVILTQGLCGRCAVDTALVHEAVDQLMIDPTVCSLTAITLTDVLDNIAHLGEVLGCQERAERKREYLQHRIDAIESTATHIDTQPRVAIFEWLDPPTLSGHWVPEFIELLDADCDLTTPGADSAPIDWAQLIEFDPEVIIAAPCGFTLEQTVERFPELTTQPGWDSLSAVKHDDVYAMAGKPYMNRTTPRLVDSLEIVAQILYPGVFGQPPDTVVRQIT